MPTGIGDVRTRQVDAVVVSYNSGATLHACVEPLARMAGVAVTVVDNDSHDDSLAVVAGLPVCAVRSGRNGGFAFGCNLGAATGSAPYILLLNPDARLAASALNALCDVLDREADVGAVGPRVLDDEGRLQRTQRNYPRLRSTWAQALFLHRLRPRANWADEVIRDERAYAQRGAPEWLSGACLLVRRSAFVAVGGLDERFFLYCEDIDLCRRLRTAGYGVCYEPAATVHHTGGVSAPRGSTAPVYARSRIAYARKHYRRMALPLERAGVAVGEATHALAALPRPAKARGHAAALRAVLTPAVSRS